MSLADVVEVGTESWRLSPEESEVAARAVEGGLIDDLIPQYELNRKADALNAVVAGRVGDLLGRPVAFPIAVSSGEDERQGWVTDGWRRIGSALVERSSHAQRR